MAKDDYSDAQSSSAVSIVVEALASRNSSPSRRQLILPALKRSIPDKVLIGYGTNCDPVRKAVHHGVNVVIWAFMDIVAACDDVQDIEHHSSTTNDEATTWSSTDRNMKENGQQRQAAKIQTDLDLDKIRHLIRELDENGYSDVIHLVSFGGWNGPHLDPNLSAEDWYACWKDSVAGDLFHGIDWDIEGNDDLDSPFNVFTPQCLDKMGHISRFMKEDAYIVGMAPPQSYMNFNNSHFSRYVNRKEPDRPWHAEFNYFGANAYSYVLAKYGDYIDFVSMQLYESYSLAAMSVYHQHMTPEDYLVSYIQDLVIQQQSKFYVDFSQDKDLDMEGQDVHLPLSKLVIGFANGWAADEDNTKQIYISPEQVQTAYDILKASKHGDLTPRGFMFWTIEEEGTNDVFLSRDLRKVLRIRE